MTIKINRKRLAQIIALSSLAGCLPMSLHEPTSTPYSITGDAGDVKRTTTFNLPERAVFNDGGAERLTGMRKKKPLLVYYAVDSAEPFMQLAVDTEIRALRRTCTQSSRPNWIALVNSHVSQSNLFLSCRDGVLHEHDVRETILKGGPSLETLVSQKVLGDKDEYDLRNCNISPIKCQRYLEYPLTHPAVLERVVKWIDAGYESDQYTLIVHLKSHGAPGVPATSLTPVMIEHKTKRQQEAWRKIARERNSTHELSTLPLGQAGLGDRPPVSQDVLVALGFNRQRHAIANLGDKELGDKELGDKDLGDKDLGIDGVASLAIGSSGLGAMYMTKDEAFGMESSSVASILVKSKLSIGFVFLESCSTQLWQYWGEQKQFDRNPPASYYSATGSLWYRNLDWDDILGSLGPSPNTGAMIDHLELVTSELPNLVETELRPNASRQSFLDWCRSENRAAERVSDLRRLLGGRFSAHPKNAWNSRMPSTPPTP